LFGRKSRTEAEIHHDDDKKKKEFKRKGMIISYLFMMSIDVTCVCEIIGSKKEPHQPVEQQRSLPQDEDEQGVRIMCLFVPAYVCVY